MQDILFLYWMFPNIFTFLQFEVAQKLLKEKHQRRMFIGRGEATLLTLTLITIIFRK